MKAVYALPEVEKDVVLTMTESEAQTLLGLARLDRSIPDLYDDRHAAVVKALLASLRSALASI